MREKKLSTSLAQYYSELIRENINNDLPYLLPSALTKLLSFNPSIALQLIPLFPPTGNKEKDMSLVSLYKSAPIESMEHIKVLCANGSREIVAYAIKELSQSSLISYDVLVGLILLNPDPKALLSQSNRIAFKDDEIHIPTLVTLLNPVNIAESISSMITKNMPDRIEKEV